MSKKQETVVRKNSLLKKGDTVMVIAGGNKKKRPLKGQVSKIVRFVGDNKDRVILEGLNLMTRHQRAAGPQKAAGKIQKEGSMHVSNVMYYVEKLKRPVRLKHQVRSDGKKVRGYSDPTTKQFVEI